MATTTRHTLLRRLAADLFPERYVEFSALSGSTATVVQGAELRHGDASGNALDPGWLYVYEGPSIGDDRSVVTYEPRATASYGTVEVSRPLTTTPTTSSMGFVYAGGLSPTQLIAHLNTALRRMRRQRALPLGLLTDGLMEVSGTSYWTASSSTLSKSSTAARVTEGAQSLLVANIGSNGYAAAQTVLTVPGEQLRVEAACIVGVTGGTHTATLEAYDGTHGTVVASVSTESRVPVRLSLDVAVPSGCIEMVLRLKGSASDTSVYWDEVLVWRPQVRQVRLPTTLTKFDQIHDVFQRMPRSDYVDDYDLVRLPNWELLADPSGASQFILDVSRSGWSPAYPLVVKGLLPWDELSSDTSVTACDPDELMLRAKALAYAQLARIGPREDRGFYQKQAEWLGRTWATAAAWQPRPAVPIKGPRSRRASGRLGGMYRGL